MSRKITICCVALCLTLNLVAAAHRTLNSVYDLTLPANVLLLLRWFANEVHINREIRLTFNPNTDHGSHRYHNSERVLDSPPWGCQYYTLGNLHQGSFPHYVSNAPMWNTGWNRARIIFSVRGYNTQTLNGQIIDRVYITQHFGRSDDQGTRYDPENTHEVTINFLREIRQLSINQIYQIAGNSQPRQSNMSHLQGDHSSNEYSYRPSPATTPTSQDDCLRTFLICLAIIVIVLLFMFSLGNVRKY